MRIVLDYGGTIVEHDDEREYAHVLDVDAEREPYPGWIAYLAFKSGLLETEAQYRSLLSTLTGATEAQCAEYVERTWLSPRLPTERRAVLRDLAAEHSLVLFSNMAKPWILRVLERSNLLDCFDDLLVSSELKRQKPHPRGYVRCLADTDEPVVMVSDEANDDLLMARQFDMTTVWIRNSHEIVHVQPDFIVDSFVEVPHVVATLSDESG